jgi:putative hemolysin
MVDVTVQDFPFNPTVFQENPSALLKMLFPVLKRVLGFAKFNEVYQAVAHTISPEDFLQSWMQQMNIEAVFDPATLENIPKDGPVMIVANHSLGGIDALLFALLLLKHCNNSKMLGSYLFHALPQVQDYVIAIDQFQSKSATNFNTKGLKEIIRWIKAGNQLGVFPSGTVAHFQVKKLSIVEPAWDPRIARIIRLCEVPVVPVFFGGNNSWLFHAAGLIHPLFRTALLISQVMNKFDARIPIVIGNQIPYAQLSELGDDVTMINHLRACTYKLNPDAFHVNK